MYSTIHLIIYIKTLGESLSAYCDDSARWRGSVLVVSEVALSGSCGESLSDLVSTWHKNKLHRTLPRGVHNLGMREPTYTAMS